MNRISKSPTKAQIDEVLQYIPETGDFLWHKPGSRRRIGQVAGGICTGGYRQILVNGRLEMAHRMAWITYYGSAPPHEIDHINGKKDDNRIANLRAVDHKENGKNQRMRSDNTSGVTGVSYVKRLKKWRAEIMADGRAIYIGIYSEMWDAICARKYAENKHGFHENHGK